MQKHLRLRFMILTWGLLMLLMAAIGLGIGVYMGKSAETAVIEAIGNALLQFDEPGNRMFAGSNYGMAAIRLDGNGNVTDLRTSHLQFSMGSAEEAAAQLQEMTSESGIVTIGDSSYRYRYEYGNGEKHIVLAERSQELQRKASAKEIVVWIALLSGILLLPMSLLLSRWVTKPIEAAWEKQNAFVSDATHELKTPLAVITTNTEAILANDAATIESQAKWFGSIQGETSRMSSLVRDLLFLAKADAGEIRLDVEELHISELLEGMLMEWEVTAFEAERQFDYEVTPSLIYYGDWDRIKQMTEAMLDNAVSYTPKGGSIQVEVNRDKRMRLRIVISNTGAEIPEGEREKIFDRFYRLDASRARETGGSGLGLSVARCIVGLHNGTITAESAGGINTFTAVLGAVTAESE